MMGKGRVVRGAQEGTVNRPCAAATSFGGVANWTSTFDGQWLEINHATRLSASRIRQVEVRRRLMWSDVVLVGHSNEETVLAGLDHRSARGLSRALQAAAEEEHRRCALLDELHVNGPRIAAWWSQVVATMSVSTWITRSQVEALEARRPITESGPRLVECWFLPDFATHVAALPASWSEAVAGWANVDLRAWATQTNDGLLLNEKQTMRDWFDVIEKAPLTEEQIDAVIRFDNRTLVVAAAGSGKTSTMVAKAAYAIARGIAQPDEILMLAFNQKAAEEMGERVASKLTGSVPDSSTFHAFGLRVIGEATECKPRVADLRDDGIGRLSKVIKSLCMNNAAFRRDWDLFRLVYGRPLEDNEPSDADLSQGGSPSFPTVNGEMVRSQGEQMIANWLWLNGIRYEYESQYKHQVGDSSHGQYLPDFYYPDLDVYHEHWATDQDGRVPARFEGYAAAMRWRQETHRAYGTTLIETCWGDLLEGTLLDRLEEQLTRLGATFDRVSPRTAAGQPPVEDARLLKLVRAFMVHAKNNRTDLSPATSAGIRERLFLRLLSQVIQAWNEGLRREGLVDFEDMLNQAIDLIEAGAWPSPYRLIMVDELQDTSVARARLVKALLDRATDTLLFAVGDDWQSIYRFAGSDLSVMSGFERWFGPSDVCYLTRTFRSPQALCDIASTFVMKNTAQITKRVVSDRPGPESPVTVQIVSRYGYVQAVEQHLQALDDAATEDLSVLILGRYRADQKPVSALAERHWSHLRVTTDTVHRAKGAEADHVIVLNVVEGAFPSTIRDDPLLGLALPNMETFPDAEERRLFYVAITRARQSVLLVTEELHESPFVLELVRGGLVTIRRPDRRGGTGEACPACVTGEVVRVPRRDGGAFMGCSRWQQGCRWNSSIGRWQSTSAAPALARA